MSFTFSTQWMILFVLMGMNEMNPHRRLNKGPALLILACRWIFKFQCDSSAYSEKKYTYVHLLPGKLSRKSVSLIATSELTSMPPSSTARRWVFDEYRALQPESHWFADDQDPGPLHTWHFSTFNQHILLSTKKIYCEMKTLSFHVVCKLYIPPRKKRNIQQLSPCVLK